MVPAGGPWVQRGCRWRDGWEWRGNRLRTGAGARRADEATLSFVRRELPYLCGRQLRAPAREANAQFIAQAAAREQQSQTSGCVPHPAPACCAASLPLLTGTS